MRYGVLACVMLLVLGRTAVSHAQTVPAETAPDAARDLYERGMEANNQGRFGEALEVLRRSYALRPSASVSFQMGVALQGLGRLVEALDRFQDYLQLASPTLRNDYATDYTARMADIEHRLGHLRIATLDPDTARVTVDGHGVSLDVSHDVAVDPGEHVVAAERAGYRGRSWRVTVSPGQRVDEEITLAPVPADEPHPFYTQWWFWTGIGLVVAAATTTAVTLAESGPAAPPSTNTGAIYRLPFHARSWTP